MNCPNCQSPLSCGCQKRRATNGAEVCTTCIAFYEAALANPEKTVQPNINVPNLTDSTPTDVRIAYIPPKT